MIWWKVVVVLCLLVRSARLSADSYYSVLGVQRTASPHEVRQAYKKLAVKLHPDKNPDEAVQEKFLKITEAYETLKDEEKRRNYDLHGSGPRPFYSRQYDASSQTEYNNLYYNGLYAGDEFVDTLSPASFQSYITEGMHFIKLYSPFCPPCQSLSDHWRKLAELYKGIMKVGAVNCKYHNSFCYNVLRVGSYPTLLFYPNGKPGEHVEYSGDHTLPALELFVLQHMRAAAPASTARARVSGTCLYVLGATRVPEETLLRIAYRLRGVARVVLVEDEQFRASLTQDERVTCVVQHGTRDRPLYSDDELDVTRAVLDLLPALDTLDPDHLKKIRDELRSESGSARPWVVHLAAPGGDRLLLHKMKAAFPDLQFGVVECARWPQLCATLHTGATPGWGVVKRGGAYQAMARDDDVMQFLHAAPPATNLHSLSPSEADRVLAGEQGSWLVLVVPHRASTLSQRALPAAALRLLSLSQLQVGIASCAAASSAAHCARARPALLLVHEGHTHEHDAHDLHADHVVRFVQLAIDNPVVTLSEQQLLEVIDPARSDTWLVSFLPPDCGPTCDSLRHQWRILADKLRPLERVHVAVLDCTHTHVAFCVNIRAPTARVYPPASTQTYVANMQHLSTAPYLLEWALQHLHPAPRPLTGDTFPRALRGELDTSRPARPWLVYFHSPRCYRCYEMFADFAIAATVLQASLEAGRVNCLAEHALCQREGISVYPSLRLYLPRAPPRSLPLDHHDALVADLRALLPRPGWGGEARIEL